MNAQLKPSPVLGNPYAAADADYFNGLDEDLARDAWEAARIEKYAQEYWKGGDLYDALGTLPDAEERANKAWREMERGSLVAAFRQFREIMELAAKQHAAARVAAELDEMRRSGFDCD